MSKEVTFQEFVADLPAEFVDFLNEYSEEQEIVANGETN